MKKIIALIVMLFVALGTSTAFARGHHGYGGHYDRSYSHHSHRHHNDGLGIALGVVGGLVLGSALVSGAPPPPPVVVYERRYAPPRICYDDQVVTGEWQYSRYYGRDIWVSYTYPETRRVQVPCY